MTSCASKTTSDGQTSFVRIDELFASGATHSFEFFPPKSDEEGVRLTRALAEHPDTIIAATLSACPHCAHALAPADMAGAVRHWWNTH